MVCVLIVTRLVLVPFIIERTKSINRRIIHWTTLLRLEIGEEGHAVICWCAIARVVKFDALILAGWWVFRDALIVLLSWL